MLLTRSPLIPRASTGSSFDLHVLSTPPAFILSQNQTLRKIHYKKLFPSINPQLATRGVTTMSKYQKTKQLVSTKNKTHY